MKKTLTLLFVASLLNSCTNNTNTNNNENNTAQPTTESSPTKPNDESHTKDEPSKKTDVDYALEIGQVLLDKASNALRKKEIKDSLKIANKAKYFAFQIGMKVHKKEAIKTYKKLLDAGVTSIFIFHIKEKENYIVKFEAKSEEELELLKGEFKTQLGEFGNEGLEIINLTDKDYCSTNATITKLTESEDGVEIKYLVCE